MGCLNCKSLGKGVGKFGMQSTVGKAGFSMDEIANALKEALKEATKWAVDTASAAGAFNDPKLHIPWPAQASSVAEKLRGIGLGGQVDEFETTMNRAAEQVRLTPPFWGSRYRRSGRKGGWGLAW